MLIYARNKRNCTIMMNIRFIGSRILRPNGPSWTTEVSSYDLLNHRCEAGEIDLSLAYCNVNECELP